MSEDEEEDLAAFIYEASMEAFYSTYAASSSSSFASDDDDDDDEEMMAGRPGKKTTAKKQYRKKKCSVAECKYRAINGGVCRRHGAKVKVKLCSSEGCTNQAKKGGVCVRHGAKRYVCSSEGELHETIAALHLEEWRDVMNDEIDSINQILPNASAGGWDDDYDFDDEGDPGEKTQAIRRWIRSVLCKIIRYKSEHRRLLDDAAATLDLVLSNSDTVMNNVLPFIELPSYTFDVGDDDEDDSDEDTVLELSAHTIEVGDDDDEDDSDEDTDSRE
jgi:hypothetical protein